MKTNVFFILVALVASIGSLSAQKNSMGWRGNQGGCGNRGQQSWSTENNRWGGCGNWSDGDRICGSFIDENGDGVCDFCLNENCNFFVDENGDGVCDINHNGGGCGYFVDEDNDGYPDQINNDSRFNRRCRTGFRDNTGRNTTIFSIIKRNR